MATKVKETITPIQITISLLECKCLSFKLSEYGLKNKTPIKVNSYEYMFMMNFNLIDKDNQVRVMFNAKLFEKKESGEKIELGELNATTLFFIANYIEVIKKDSSNLHTIV